MTSKKSVKRGSLTAKLIGYYFAAYDSRAYEGAWDSYLAATAALARRGRATGNSRCQADPTLYAVAQAKFYAQPLVKTNR